MSFNGQMAAKCILEIIVAELYKLDGFAVSQ